MESEARGWYELVEGVDVVEVGFITLDDASAGGSPDGLVESDGIVTSELIPLEDAVSQLKKDSRIITAINIRLKQLKLARKGFDETSKPNLLLLAQVKHLIVL